MGRVVGWELSFTEDFVVIPTIDLEIQLFVGLVMIESVLLSLNARAYLAPWKTQASHFHWRSTGNEI